MGSIWPLGRLAAWTLGRLAPLAVKLHPRRQFRITDRAWMVAPPPQAAKRQTALKIRAPRRCTVRRLFVATMQPAPPRAAHSRRAAPRPVALHGRASRRIETRAGHRRHCHRRRTGPLGRAFPLHLDERRRPRRRLDHRRGISAPNRRTLGRRPTQRPHPRLIPGALCPRDVAPHAPAVAVAHVRPPWPIASRDTIPARDPLTKRVQILYLGVVGHVARHRPTRETEGNETNDRHHLHNPPGKRR